MDAVADAAAMRRLYPVQFLEAHLNQDVRPDGRPLTRCRPTSIALNAVSTAEGSALVKIGDTTMLAGIKLEVMVPPVETPDQGSLTVEFIMPPTCSSRVRPGRPSEETYVVSQQLSNALISSGLVNLCELCITSGKAAWRAYLDVYCLNADGALLDAALLASVAALSHLQLPAISVGDEGRVVSTVIPDPSTMEDDQKSLVIQSKKLTLGRFPSALTVAMDKKYLVADPTDEEETILRTTLTLVVDSERLISLHKAGGPTTAATSTVQDCVALAQRRHKKLQQLLIDAAENQAAELN